MRRSTLINPSDLRTVFLTGHAKENALKLLISQKLIITAIVVPDVKKYRDNYQQVILTAKKNKIPVVLTEPQKIASKLKSLQFNILISCGYPFKIPKPVFSKATYAINFHPTLLPKHRGKYVHHVLTGRDNYSGVTAHLIEEGMDTGPIIGQKKFQVSPFETVKSLLRKSQQAEIQLIPSIINAIKDGRLRSKSQDESKACSHFGTRSPDDSEVNPKKSLKTLYYEMRAYDADLYPPFFYVGHEKVFVKLYRKEKPADESDMI